MHGPRFRLRFTIRRLMVAIAVVALLMGSGLWVVKMRTRSAAYRRRAFEFGEMTGRVGKSVPGKGGRRLNAYDDENDWLEDAWSYKLAEKYWRLADCPWLPVEPDPLPPERLVHPRSAVDLPADFPSGRWCRFPVYPWWTFLWTWRTSLWPQDNRNPRQ